MESTKKVWGGRVLSGFAVLFLLVDSVMKFMKTAPAVQGTVELGYPESVLVGLGMVLLICTLLYAIPQTSVVGAVLLTGYLGGPWRLRCASGIHGLVTCCSRCMSGR